MGKHCGSPLYQKPPPPLKPRLEKRVHAGGVAGAGSRSFCSERHNPGRRRAGLRASRRDPRTAKRFSRTSSTHFYKRRFLGAQAAIQRNVPMACELHQSSTIAIGASRRDLLILRHRWLTDSPLSAPPKIDVPRPRPMHGKPMTGSFPFDATAGAAKPPLTSPTARLSPRMGVPHNIADAPEEVNSALPRVHRRAGTGGGVTSSELASPFLPSTRKGRTACLLEGNRQRGFCKATPTLQPSTLRGFAYEHLGRMPTE